MEYLELSIPFLATTIAVLLAWFLVKKKQNTLAIAEESAIKDKLQKETFHLTSASQTKGEDAKSEEEEEPFDIMEARERLAPFLLDASELEYLDDEPGQHKTPNIQTYYKKSRLKIQELEKNMTKDELEHERNAQRKQLEDIFKVMEKNKDQFGVESFQELEDQMKLYSK